MYRPHRRALSRALLPIVVTVLGTALLTPTASVATTSTAVRTTTTISPSRSVTVDYWSRPVIRTQVRTTSGTPIAGRAVELWRRPMGNPTWVRATTKTTNSAGRAVFAYRAMRPYHWQFRFPASGRYAYSASGAALVQVRSMGATAIRQAAKHRGKPYRYGAAGPSRFDCSGFTLYVYRTLGRSLPHNSGQQAAKVRAVSKSAKRVGDLVFTYSSSGRIYHVGIYAGNNEIWHSPHSGDVVKRSKIWSSRYRVGRIG